jgi:hypothetical protein
MAVKLWTDYVGLRDGIPKKELLVISDRKHKLQHPLYVIHESYVDLQKGIVECPIPGNLKSERRILEATKFMMEHPLSPNTKFFTMPMMSNLSAKEEASGSYSVHVSWSQYELRAVYQQFGKFHAYIYFFPGNFVRINV